MPLGTPVLAAAALDDAELARAIAGGDVHGFEQLMRRYNRVLFRTARAILKDDGEAEDALQEGLSARVSLDRRVPRRRASVDLAHPDRRQRGARPPAQAGSARRDPSPAPRR